MAIVEGQETGFFQKTGFLSHRVAEQTLLSQVGLVQSNLDVYVLGQVMMTNLDEYLAKIRAVCDGSSEDEELYEAIANFCRQTDNRKRRGAAFTHLWKKLQGSKGLKRLQYPSAGSIIWVKVYEQIGSEFEPQEGSKSLRSSVVTWINRKLGMEYADREEQRRLQRQTGGPTVSLDAPRGKDDNGNNTTLATLLPSKEPEPMEKTVEEEDQENQEQILGKVYEVADHPREYPQCTFGEIIKRLYGEHKKKWEEIKAEFNIPKEYQLRSWYCRRSKTIFAKIRQSLQEE